MSPVGFVMRSLINTAEASTGGPRTTTLEWLRSSLLELMKHPPGHKLHIPEDAQAEIRTILAEFDSGTVQGGAFTARAQQLKDIWREVFYDKPTDDQKRRVRGLIQDAHKGQGMAPASSASSSGYGPAR